MPPIGPPPDHLHLASIADAGISYSNRDFSRNYVFNSERNLVISDGIVSGEPTPALLERFDQANREAQADLAVRPRPPWRIAGIQRALQLVQAALHAHEAEPAGGIKRELPENDDAPERAIKRAKSEEPEEQPLFDVPEAVPAPAEILALPPNAHMARLGQEDGSVLYFDFNHPHDIGRHFQLDYINRTIVRQDRPNMPLSLQDLPQELEEAIGLADDRAGLVPEDVHRIYLTPQQALDRLVREPLAEQGTVENRIRYVIQRMQHEIGAHGNTLNDRAIRTALGMEQQYGALAAITRLRAEAGWTYR